MSLYALIGNSLSHSSSASYFNEKFQREHLDNSYILHPVPDLSGLYEWIKSNADLVGFNVTIPYKQKIIPLLNTMSVDAEAIGAVNVVKVIREGDKFSLKGYNSDSPAFRESLKPLLPAGNISALILGTGGASKAVAYALRSLGISYSFVSRKSADDILSYQQLTENVIKSHRLIINTTPVGMSPNIEKAPDIPYQYLSQNHICYDLIYNPEETLFMRSAAEKGAVVKNGLEMLHRQADISWQIWNTPL